MNFFSWEGSNIPRQRRSVLAVCTARTLPVLPLLFLKHSRVCLQFFRSKGVYAVFTLHISMVSYFSAPFFGLMQRIELAKMVLWLAVSKANLVWGGTSWCVEKFLSHSYGSLEVHWELHRKVALPGFRILTAWNYNYVGVR